MIKRAQCDLANQILIAVTRFLCLFGALEKQVVAACIRSWCVALNMHHALNEVYSVG